MKYVYIFSALLLISSCVPKSKYPIGHFPYAVTNFELLNSAFDDFNSNLEFLQKNVAIDFSSNRQQVSGGSFNIESETILFDWNLQEGQLTIQKVSNQNFGPTPSKKVKLQLTINDACQQKGPYSFQDSNRNEIFLYASACDGNSNMMMTRAVYEGNDVSYLKPIKIVIQDENSSEMYPSFFGPNFTKNPQQNPVEPEKMVFSSDRDGVFDIYEVDLPKHKKILEFLENPEGHQVKKSSLNSSSNDHAPFVFENMLVFASDRPGGFGGYDLYYSVLTNGNWSEPINFGPSINSEFDEFRPVVEDMWNFTNHLLVFSSNRPGGKGGFDLYYIGIEKQ